MQFRLLLCGLTMLSAICGLGDPPRCSTLQIDSRMEQLDRRLLNVISQINRLESERKSYFCRPQLAAMRADLSQASQTLSEIRYQWDGSKQAYEERCKLLHEQNEALDKQNKDLEDNRGVGSYWMWIVIGIGALGIAAVAFFVVAGRRKPVVVASREDELPKCPRCGWKYTRGETKCRNCGTRF